MGLRVKILSGFLILALMLLIAGVWSVYQLKTLGTSVQQLLDENYKSINAADIMLESLEREDSGILLLMLGKWEKGREIINSADTSFDQGYHIARNNVTIPGEGDYVEQINAKYQSYKNLWKKPIVGTKREGDLSWYLTNVHDAFLNTKASINALKALNEKTLYHTASDLKNRANRAVMPGTVAIISALLFSLVFSYFVNYFMISPIIEITRSVEIFEKNDKPFDVSIETNDEIGNLAKAIKLLSTRIIASKGT
jgi:HAMP domain-containing protein